MLFKSCVADTFVPHPTPPPLGPTALQQVVIVRHVVSAAVTKHGERLLATQAISLLKMKGMDVRHALALQFHLSA